MRLRIINNYKIIKKQYLNELLKKYKTFDDGYTIK